MLLKLDTVLTRTLFTLPRQVAPVPQSMEATNEVYFFKKKKKKQMKFMHAYTDPE
jgi:hypothetical protein